MPEVVGGVGGVLFLLLVQVISAVQCPGGEWLSAQGSCVPCPMGTFCLGDNVARPCDGLELSVDWTAGSRANAGSGGHWTTGSGSLACEACTCGPGTYCLYGTDCLPCPPGFECPGTQGNGSMGQYTSVASLSSCPVGRYSAAYGATGCTSCDCPRGSYCASADSALCTQCPQGAWCADSVMHVCQGSWSVALGASNISVCTPCSCGTGGAFCTATSPSCSACAAGSSCVDSMATACGYGAFADAPASTSCTSCLCAPGSYCYGTSFCNPCFPGFSCTNGTMSACPDGWWATWESATCEPCQCTDGQWCDATTSVCSVCAAGSYCAGSASQPCPQGFWAPANSSSCQQCLCVPGAFCAPETGLCTECPAGQACVDSVALPCVAGTYAARSGTTACLDCQCLPGQYCVAASATCMTCPAGSSCNGSAPTACLCAPGSYCPAGWAKGFFGSLCDPCPAGSFCAQGGSAVPEPCLAAPGRYCALGSKVSSGISCPSGSWCPGGASTVQPCLCAPGTYCAQGLASMTCLSCPAGSACPGADWPPQSCVPGTYSYSGLSVCSPCPAGMFNPAEGQAQCLSCPAGTYGIPSLLDSKMSGTTVFALTLTARCRRFANLDVDLDLDLSSSTDTDSYNLYLDSDDSVSLDPETSGSTSSGSGGSGSDADPGSRPFFQQVEWDCAWASAWGNRPGARAAWQAAAVANSSAVCRSCAPGTANPAGALAASACPDCAPGTYANVSAARTCVSCPYGTYRAAGGATALTDCLACPGGSYTLATGQAACLLCLPGRYAPLSNTSESGDLDASASDDPSQMACWPCGLGTFNAYSGRQGVESCSLCPAGRFADASASVACTACPAGRFLGTEGASSLDSCASCSSGAYCPMGSSGAMACPAGRYGPVQGQGSLATGCLFCPAGTYCPIGGVAPLACPQGSYCPTGVSAPKNCLAGYASAQANATSSAACVACTVGRAASSTGSTSCSDCPGGRFSSVAGATVCAACSVGRYAPAASAASQCLACPAGSANPSSAQVFAQACVSCVPGTYANDTGSAICQTCSAGTYNAITGASAAWACLPCPAAKRCPEGAALPLDLGCPAGQYVVSANGTGDQVCASCGPGRFCTGAEAADQDCPLGAYCPEGATEPQWCDAGTANNSTGSSEPWTCVACEAGRYAAASGQSECEACLPGTAVATQGARVCLPCVQGYHAPETGQTNCTPCLDVDLCLAGASGPLDLAVLAPWTDLAASFSTETALGSMDREQLFASLAVGMASGPAISDAVGVATTQGMGTDQALRLWVLVVSGTVALVVSVAYAGFRRHPAVKKALRELDWLYDTKHYVPVGTALRRHPRALGGLFTVLVLAFGVALLLMGLADYLWAQPFVFYVSPRAAPFAPRGRLAVAVQLIGAPAACTAVCASPDGPNGTGWTALGQGDGQATTENGLFTVVAPGDQELVPSTGTWAWGVRDVQDMQCTWFWECRDCEVATSNALSVTLALSHPLATAAALAISVHSPGFAAASGDPDPEGWGDATLSQLVWPGGQGDLLLRGTTMLQLSLVTAVLSGTSGPLMVGTLMQQSSAVTLGSVVNATEWAAKADLGTGNASSSGDSGLQVQVVWTPSALTYQVAADPQSLLALVAQLGSLVGTMIVCGTALLSVIERCAPKARRAAARGSDSAVAHETVDKGESLGIEMAHKASHVQEQPPETPEPGASDRQAGSVSNIADLSAQSTARWVDCLLCLTTCSLPCTCFRRPARLSRAPLVA